ncbi:MAG: hypothetical protein K2X81_26000 [Candidatus Obscuribacterales bacterium]|nr:hypothetical protein [Candidatus Obscuribacterales bacterium]
MEILVEILVAVLSMVVLSVAFRILFKLNGDVDGFDQQVKFDDDKRDVGLSNSYCDRFNLVNINHNND